MRIKRKEAEIQTECTVICQQYTRECWSTIADSLGVREVKTLHLLLNLDLSVILLTCGEFCRVLLSIQRWLKSKVFHYFYVVHGGKELSQQNNWDSWKNASCSV